MDKKTNEQSETQGLADPHLTRCLNLLTDICRVYA